MTAKQDPYVPKVDEVKDRVRDEVVKQKARDVSKQKAAEIAAKLKGAPDFEKAAKAAGVEAKTTDLIAAGAPIPDLGVAPAVEDAAFKLPVGAVSDPIATDNGSAVIKVVEKKAVTTEEWNTSKDRFREELLDHRVHPVGVLSQRLASARAALGCRDKLRPGGLDALTPQGPWIGRCVNR